MNAMQRVECSEGEPLVEAQYDRTQLKPTTIISYHTQTTQITRLIADKAQPTHWCVDML
jgi:hypothetical protein